MKVKEESEKVGLKLNIQTTKIRSSLKEYTPKTRYDAQYAIINELVN